MQNVALPPHLSPFIDDEAEGYVPKQREIINKWIQNASPVDTKQADNLVETSEAAEVAKQDIEKDFFDGVQKELNASTIDNNGEEIDTNIEPSASEIVDSANPMKELAKTMMSKKHKRLYSRMMHGIEKKKDAQKNLLEKRQKIEDGNLQ